MFQNRLFHARQSLDRKRRVWLEDEGRTLGKLLIPDPFWDQMRAAPVVFVDIPQRQRIDLLVEEYASYEKNFLEDSIDRIARRLGPERHRFCQDALRANEFSEVARECLNYYDRAYLHSLNSRSPDPLWKLPLETTGTEQNVDALLKFMSQQTCSA